MRLIDANEFKLDQSFKFNSSNNAFLIQDEDKLKFNFKDFKVVSKLKPNHSQMKNLVFLHLIYVDMLNQMQSY